MEEGTKRAEAAAGPAPRRASATPRILAAAAVAAVGLGCGGEGGDAPEVTPGVSQELAEHRAHTISDVRYDLRFDLPADPERPVAGTARVRFVLARPGPVVLDFEEPTERVRSVRVNGRSVEPRPERGHLVLPAGAARAGENEVEVVFVAGDGPLNRDREYLYTLFVPDRAHRAFPCFDQPDLKARFRLTVAAPASWEVVSNTAAEGVEAAEGGRRVHRFGETAPLPTYLFSFAAGAFRVEEAERDGRRLRLFHRETDEGRVAGNLDAIFDLHAEALAWLEDYTGIPYPFGKFDVVAIPAFQYNGMEHPGAILYRQEGLFLDPSATQVERLDRAGVIAHETAHMWFGDLVTMRWFDDVWMKEVFANFMAAKVVHPSFPEIDHDLRFLLAHYPEAYGVDRTAGANPIRQELENLSDAGTLYGAIIYRKAPIVMKHLELRVGEAAMRAGLREYLDAHRFGNASWPDLIRVLDRRTPDDLGAWSRVWVERPGRPEVRPSLSLGSETIASLALRQRDPRGEDRVWPQPLAPLLAYEDGEARRLPVRLEDREAPVEGARGLPRPTWLLVNGDGIGYGYFPLEEATRRWMLERLPSVPDAIPRAVAWMSLWDEMLEGRVAPVPLVDLALRLLEAEQVELLAEHVLGDLRAAYWRFLVPAERERIAPGLEALLWRRMEAAADESFRATWFRAWRSTAITPAAVERMRALWSGELRVPGLELSERDLTELSLELAVREATGWEEILDRQAARIENPDRRERFAFVRPALSADPTVRDAFFRGLLDPEGRRHEPWVVEGLEWLHHPLRAPASVRYIRPALEKLEEVRRTGDIFFPRRWLDATLGGHGSPEAAQEVTDFLRTGPELPRRLREKLLQAADPLFRAAGRPPPGSD